MMFMMAWLLFLGAIAIDEVKQLWSTAIVLKKEYDISINKYLPTWQFIWCK